MAPHDEVAEEWVALGDRSLIPSAIFYKPKINSRTVQGGGGLGMDSGRKAVQTKAAYTLLDRPKGVVVMDGQEAEIMCW